MENLPFHRNLLSTSDQSRVKTRQTSSRVHGLKEGVGRGMLPFKGLERSWKLSQTRRQRDSRNDQSNRLRLFLSDAHCKYSANQRRRIVLIRGNGGPPIRGKTNRLLPKLFCFLFFLHTQEKDAFIYCLFIIF